MNHRLLISGLADEASPLIQNQIEAHMDLGWTNIELRTIQGVALADLSKDEFNKVVTKITKENLNVPTIASRIGNWQRPITNPFEEDLEELKILSERMHQLGSKYLRIMSYPNDGLSCNEWEERVFERLYKLVEIAKGEDIILLHENCSGWGGVNVNNTIKMMNCINDPNLKLLFDIGNGIAYGYDSLDFLQLIYPYVAHVHIKDGYVNPVGEEVYTYPGEGTSKVYECMNFLVKKGYNGIFAIEPHVHLIPHKKQMKTEEILLPTYIKYGQLAMELLEKAIKKGDEHEQLTF